jgi:hypothetical protein
MFVQKFWSFFFLNVPFDVLIALLDVLNVNFYVSTHIFSSFCFELDSI